MVFISPAVDIKKETVRLMAKRFNPRGLKEAITSPMLEVEPYIVELIDQLSKIRSPITCCKGLQIANRPQLWDPPLLLPHKTTVSR